MISIKNMFNVTVVSTILLLLSANQISAAEADISKALKACKNISAQQRQMAQAAGYDIDSLCATAESSLQEESDVSRPEVVRPNTSLERSSDNAIEQSSDSSRMLNDAMALLSESDSELENLSNTGKLEQFGYDLFAGVPTTFAPATEIPVMTDYVIGPGDTVEIQLFGKESNSYSLVVNRDGSIQFPDLGPISVAGLTFSEMKSLLNTRVEKQMIGVQASISMGELRSVRIFVLGDVNRPGSYTVSSLSTITNALFVSGGIRKIGSLRNIQLKRRGEVVSTMDLYDLLLNGDTRGDERLLPGDVIFIPPIGKTVGISGEVKRPAIYELDSESSMFDLVTLAGGYLATAYPEATIVERISSGVRTLIDVDLTVASGKAMPTMNGDIVAIYSVLDKVEDVVMIDGHVYRPGGLSFKSGMRLADVITDLNMLKPIPDLDYGLIIREAKGTREISVIQFSIRNFINDRNHVDNVQLQARDKIVIFGAIESRKLITEPLIEQLKAQEKNGQPAQIVSVSGAVKFPGDYPLTPSMSVSDSVLAAGGLRESAYTVGAEITRKDYSDLEQATIKHIPVELLQHGDDQAMVEGDALIIKTIPNYQDKLVISLNGEVKFPGKYEFYRGETLSQLIKRAGGFTDLAHVEAAFFSRAELRQREAKQIADLNQKLESDIAAAQLEDANSAKKTDLATMELLKTALDDTEATGRLVLDIQAIINGDLEDLQLRDGDALYVPTYRQEVTVIGEIQNPTSHLFLPMKDFDDYIELSGGTTEKADQDRIYIIKADGSVALPEKGGWFKDNVAMQPGDTIVIPLDTNRLDDLTLWSTVSQIIYQMALGAAAIKSF